MELSERVKTLTPSSTLAITAKAKALKEEGHDVIGLGAGEPDFNTPQHIIEAAHRAAKEGETKYTPAGGLPRLKEAVSDKLRRDSGLSYTTGEIIICTGAKHALYTLFQVLLNPGDEVIVPSPYWVSYPEQIKLAGGIPMVAQTEEDEHFKLTPDALEAAITEKTKAVIVNSPSNPTGMIYTEEELRALGRVCLQHDITIVSDEIYDRLIYGGGKFVSIAQLSPELKDRTVVINGVSKTYSMTGWRIGYAAGNADLIQAMSSFVSHSTANPATISQHAAIAALEGPQKPVEDMREAFEERLNTAYEKLNSIPGVNCLKPQGAFYLFPNVREASAACGFDKVSDWVTALLEEQKVAIVPGAGFGAPNNARLSYAVALEQMEEALARIETFVKTKS